MPQITFPRLTDSLKDLKIDAAEPTPGSFRFTLTLDPDDRKPAITQLLMGATAVSIDGKPAQIQGDTVSGCSGVFDVAAHRVGA